MIVKHLAQRALAGDVDYFKFLAWQRWHGLDFSAVSVADLGLDPSRAHDHMHSGGPDLRRVLDLIGVQPTHACLDLGSGKGGSTFTLAERFGYVLGLELSPGLVDVARANLAALGTLNVDFSVADASTFAGYDSFSHAYVANSFPAAVVADVDRHIRASVRRRPRPFCVVYRYPGPAPTGAFSGATLARTIQLRHGHPFHVYRYDAR